MASVHERIREVQPKLHGLAFGMTVAIGSTMLSQGCPLVGQCSACAACVPRLPLLAVPFLADGLVVLAGRLSERRSGHAGSASGSTDALE